jgi:ribosome maturation factor RimP
MDFSVVKSKIEAWLQPLLEEKNLFLVDVRVTAGRKIEVYVDSDEGIQIEACAAISRFLEQHLDGSGIVPDNYILEVSSPGMNNALKVPRQYKKRIGRVFEIIKNDGTHIEAMLEEADDEKIKLREVKEEKKRKPGSGEVISTHKVSNRAEGAKEYVLKYDEIKSAVLQFNF